MGNYTHSHSWVVDGLHVNVVLVYQNVTGLLAEDGIPNEEGCDVAGGNKASTRVPRWVSGSGGLKKECRGVIL